MIDRDSKELSISQQCSLLGLSRSVYYYKAKGETEENLNIMELIDRQYTETPFYGALKMCAYIRSLTIEVNIKRIRRLMRLMGLQAIYCKPNLSKANNEHIKYPYLLRGLKITMSNHVWSIDITYIPMEHGFLYLVAVIDWYSRKVLSWRLSNTLEGSFCNDALEEALSKYGKPEIFNSDQGSQFTSDNFISILKRENIKISMDGKGRALDNIFIERLWRSVKYEYVYLHIQPDGKVLYNGLKDYFEFYNNRRIHQSLNYNTPDEVYLGSIQNSSVHEDLKSVS